MSMDTIREAAEYLWYHADKYNCICSARQKKRNIISPDCNHCRELDLSRKLSAIAALSTKEAADRAKNYSLEYGFTFMTNKFIDGLRAAIMGEDECLSCGRQCPNDCPQDKE